MWGLPDSRRHRPCESGPELARHLPSRQTACGRWLRSPLLAGARLCSGSVWLCPHPPLALGSSFRGGASAASSWRVVSGAASPLWGAVWSTLRLLGGRPGQPVVRARPTCLPCPLGGHVPRARGAPQCPQEGCSAPELAGRRFHSSCQKRRSSSWRRTGLLLMREARRPCGWRLGGDAPGWSLSVRPLNSTFNTDLETPA